MANNYEASGSRVPGGFSHGDGRSRNLTIGEAHAPCEAGLLVLPDWRLLSGWKISVGGYVVPPLPEGQVYEEYVH
jgi:hypothetical protein